MRAAPKVTSHDWWAFLVGLLVGGIGGFRLGMIYVPALLGKIAAWGIRKDIRSYRKRGRR